MDGERLAGRAGVLRAGALGGPELAATLRWPPSTLNNYETGRRPVPLDRLFAIDWRQAREELLKVNGIGASKRDRYGDEVLALIASSGE